MPQSMRSTDTSDLRANRSAIRNHPQNRAHAAWKRRRTGDALLLAGLAALSALLLGGLPAETLRLGILPALALITAGGFLLTLDGSESAQVDGAPAGYAHGG